MVALKNTTKTRVTVLFESQEDLSGHSISSEESIIIQGSGQLIQRRSILESFLEQDNVDSSQVVRITWKSPASRGVTAISPPLLNGLNVYVSQGSSPIEGAIDSVKYRLLHSDEFDKNILRRFLPDELSFTQFEWRDRDYDIVLGSKLRVDEYYTIEKGHNTTIQYDKSLGKSEVGLFFEEGNNDFEVNLNGVSCTWTEAERTVKCQKTYLFYQRAHRGIADSEVTVELVEPVGLHPIVATDLRRMPSSPECAYYMYLAAPVDLFIDRFQSSPIYLGGADDLELPEYKLRDRAWGFESLLPLKAREINEVKLHTRYVKPGPNGGFKLVQFNSVVFQACDSGNMEILDNPFYSKVLGFDSFFTNDTTFLHLNSTVLSVKIPLANTCLLYTSRCV